MRRQDVPKNTVTSRAGMSHRAPRQSRLLERGARFRNSRLLQVAVGQESRQPLVGLELGEGCSGVRLQLVLFYF